jgi:hypothetical protein
MELTGFQSSDLLHPQTRGLNSENASIEFVILHLRNFRIPPTGGPTHYEAGMPDLFSPLTHGVWEDNKSGQIK